MTLFITIGALLALLTLVFLTRPLWRRRPRRAAPIDAAGVASLRDQLEQLAALKQSGVLGDAQYDAARQALERRIVDAVVNDTRQRPRPSGPPHRSPCCSVWLPSSARSRSPAMPGSARRGLERRTRGCGRRPAGPAEQGHSVAPEQIEAMIDKLVARLKDDPQDADGWAMLGRSYAVLGRHEQAAPAFKQAAALRGDDAVLLADYADALAVVNGRSLDGEPSRLIEQALKIDPDNLKALVARRHARLQSPGLQAGAEALGKDGRSWRPTTRWRSRSKAASTRRASSPVLAPRPGASGQALPRRLPSPSPRRCVGQRHGDPRASAGREGAARRHGVRLRACRRRAAHAVGHPAQAGQGPAARPSRSTTAWP